VLSEWTRPAPGTVVDCACATAPKAVTMASAAIVE
jgi:hypothetical protein